MTFSTTIGVAAWAATALWMALLYFRRPHVRPFPHYGYLGLAVIFVAEVLLFRGRETVATFFTPIAWTGYIAVVDAAVYSLAGESLIQGRGREFLTAAAVSTPFWLLFEAYNLRLENWSYINLPASLPVRYFGYTWSFTTIWPAMLETAYFLRAAGLWEKEYAPVRVSEAARRRMPMWGAAMLIVPVALPLAVGPYLFGLVWLGFIFVLDPLNLRIGAPSILGDLEAGRRGRLFALLASGAICGIFWEFWNYWARSKWVYVFPILQNAKMFEMPLPGYLGFPPFAVEFFCMYVFLLAAAERLVKTPARKYVGHF